MSVGLGDDPTGTVTGDLANSDMEQDNNATVLGGDVVITDEEAQAELADGTSPDAVEGVNYDETDVNTDIDQAQVITKDENNSGSVYIDTEAIAEIANEFPTLGKAMENLEEIFEGESLQKAQTVVGRLLEMDPDSFAACGNAEVSWMNFNWLLASPAYAADPDGCLIRFSNGDILELTDEEAAAIRTTVQANAEAEMRSLLQQRADLVASGASAADIAAIDDQIAQNASYFELCGDEPGSLAASGILDGYEYAGPTINIAEGYRAGGDEIAEQFPTSFEKLQELRQSDPALYNAFYYAWCSPSCDARDPNNLDAHVLDTMYLLSGAAQTADPQARFLMLKNAAQMSANLFLTDTAFMGGKADEIQRLMQIAGSDLSEQDKFIFISTAIQITDPYNQDIAASVNRARLLTAVLIAGPTGIAIAADTYPALVACMRVTLCMNQMAITVGEMAVGDALGGATLAPAIAMVGGKLVMTKGDELLGFVDDITKEVFTWPAGTKVSLEKIVDITTLPNGKVVWLETGTNQSGLQHILLPKRAQEFLDQGVPADKVQALIFKALNDGKFIEAQGAQDLQIYEVVFEGVTRRIGIGFGSNGYITTAVPKGIVQ